MRLDFRFVCVGVFLVVLLGVAGWSRAQPAFAPRPVVPPVVFSGPDIGFRMTGVTGVKGDTPVGQLVVRVNGEWKVVEFGGRLSPATH